MARCVTYLGAAVLMTAAAGFAEAQTAPGGAGAAGAAQSQGSTAAPGAPVVGSGSGAGTGEGLGTTGGLAGAGGPATGAAAQTTNDPRLAPPVGGAGPAKP